VPHGFAIPGIKIETVLPVQEELAVKLPALEGGHLPGELPAPPGASHGDPRGAARQK
jgi:hypothetical protein